MSDLSEKLAAIEALAEDATEGPWTFQSGSPSMDGGNVTFRREGKPGIIISAHMYKDGYADAEFIAASREAVPFLLALVREQAAKLAAVEEVAERYKGIALSGTPGTMETRTAAALAAGHIRIALEARA